MNVYDTARLRHLFDNEDLQWVRQRLRQRLQKGLSLTGSISLRRPTSGEIEACDALFGRPPRSRHTLTLRLEDLEVLFCEAGLAKNLEAAIHVLEGPVENLRAKRQSIDHAWRNLFTKAEEGLEDRPELITWLDELKSQGLLKRAAGSDLEAGKRLLSDAIAVMQRLPSTGLPLPSLAAETTGDSHALDPGMPLTAIVMRGVDKVARHQSGCSPEDRREAWAHVGIFCDELSQPLLTFNLRLSKQHPLEAVLNWGREHRQPVYLTTRQLLTIPLPTRLGEVLPKVFVCENPSVVSLAADRLAQSCAPLVCVSGNLTTSAKTLLNQLAHGGVELFYHGDFDWTGLQIANYVFRQFRAQPWRLTAEDYLQAPTGKFLEGQPVATPWDARLMEAMQTRGCAVYEEQVSDVLLKDLASR